MLDLKQLKGKLIVSCQALPEEPLHGAEIMAKMALAAKIGGAAGIRANGVLDIEAIKKEVDLPLIGLIKKNYHDSEVYITPTQKEVLALVETSAEIIALDATKRQRPNNEVVQDLVEIVHHHDKLAMADVSTLEEAVQAEKDGFDIVATTLVGYTSDSIYSSEEQDKPNFKLLRQMCHTVRIPVFLEGHVSSPADVLNGLESGAYSVVVGAMITRP